MLLQFLLQRSKQNLNSTVGKGAVKRAAGSEGFGFLFYHEPHVSVHHDVYAWEHLQLPHGAVLSGCLLDTGRVCGLAVAGSVCGTRWLENPRLFGNSPFRDTDLIFFIVAIVCGRYNEEEGHILFIVWSIVVVSQVM